MSAYEDKLATVKKYSAEAFRAKLTQCGFDSDDVYTLAREQFINEIMALRGHGVHQLQKAIGQQIIASVGPLDDMGMFMQMFMQQQQQQHEQQQQRKNDAFIQIQQQKTDAYMQMFMQQHESEKQEVFLQQQEQQKQQIQLLANSLKFNIQ